MSQQTTIRKLAELVNKPVDKLLEQLAEAGMRFDGPDQVVTSIEKVKLLGFLKRAHGKDEKVAEDAAAPRKITLSRSRKQELTVGGGKNRATVDVVVRKKVVLVKTAAGTVVEPAAGEAAAPTDERAEILRKLEESRQRNLSEQQRLAETDQRRAEEDEKRRKLEAEAARAEAARVAAAAAIPAVEEDGARKVHGHGHPKPAAPRVEDKGGHKHKTRGSHAMVAGVEDDDRTSRFAGQMHLNPDFRRMHAHPRTAVHDRKAHDGGLSARKFLVRRLPVRRSTQRGFARVRRAFRGSVPAPRAGPRILRG